MWKIKTQKMASTYGNQSISLFDAYYDSAFAEPKSYSKENRPLANRNPCQHSNILKLITA
jgi:hypothetical protein